MQTSCEICGTFCGSDISPKWSVNRPKAYCARRSKCQQCKQKRKKIPTAKNIACTGETLSALLAKDEDPPSWYRCVRPATDIPATMPRTVLSWCIQCRENTRVSGGRNVYEDNRPRWTLGRKRPLCVESSPNCQNCSTRNTRFVPVDASILSVAYQVLALFIARFGRYNPEILGMLLDQWPEGSKVPRKKGKKSKKGEKGEKI